MQRLLDLIGEVPPTAGLPLRLSDFLPPFERDFSSSVADFLGTPKVQIECSGTAGLIVALLTLKRLSKRRTVVIPAYTCPLVALAITFCELRIQLCDFSLNSINMDPEMLRKLCNSDTLAILPTHLAGRVADVEDAIVCARQVGAWVIEDAAQALGARQNGVSVGLAGDIGFFSLAVGKGLTIYEGGVLVVKDENLREELRKTSAGLIRPNKILEFKRILQLIGYFALYRPLGLGLAYGLPLRRALKRGDLIAAVGDEFSTPIPLHRVGRWRHSIGSHALERLPAFLEARTHQAAERCSRLCRLRDIVVMNDPPGAQGTWPFFLLRMPSSNSRDAVLAELWSAGVGASRLFINALPDYPYLSGIAPSIEIPNARDFAACTLTISNNQWLSSRLFDRIYSVLESVTGKAHHLG